jgi:hypothetical protein
LGLTGYYLWRFEYLLFPSKHGEEQQAGLVDVLGRLGHGPEGRVVVLRREEPLGDGPATGPAFLLGAEGKIAQLDAVAAIRVPDLEKDVSWIQITVYVAVYVNEMDYFQEPPRYHPEDSHLLDRVRYPDPAEGYPVPLEDNVSRPILLEGIMHEGDERVPQDPQVPDLVLPESRVRIGIVSFDRQLIAPVIGGGKEDACRPEGQLMAEGIGNASMGQTADLRHVRGVFLQAYPGAILGRSNRLSHGEKHLGSHEAAG